MQEEALAPVLHVGDAERAIAWYQRLGFLVDTEWSSGAEVTDTTAVIRRGELALSRTLRPGGSVGTDPSRVWLWV
jgi:hypothetical protein